MGFGGGKGAKVRPQTDLQIQSASSMAPIPWCRGRGRIAGNLIDYTDFKATKHKQKAGKGFGQSVTSYTYSATVVVGLGEGVWVGILKGWKDKGEVADYAEFGFTAFLGTTPQAPWGYMAAAHPERALPYQATAYVAAANLQLGDTASLGFYSFEGQFPLDATQVGGSGDADPALCIQDFLTDTLSGVQFPAGFLDTDQLLSSVDAEGDGDSTYQTYCRAMGFGITPQLVEQSAASEILARWCLLTNSAAVWTGFSLKIVPYGDETLTANGVTYLPSTAIQYDLTDSDYKGRSGVEESISDPADAKNVYKLEVRDRANAYTTVPVGWHDPVSIETLGRRQEAEVIKGDEICEPAMGRKVIALYGARGVNIRNTYRFTLDPRFSLLEPLVDGFTLTTGEAGTSRLTLNGLPVRILSIEEDENDLLTFECEEFPAGVQHSTIASAPQVTPDENNSLDPPGPVNTPIIFEPPSTLSGGPAQVWAAVSGGDDATANPKWGGCTVYASTDDVTYQAIGVVDTPARQGLLAGALAAYGGANPQVAGSVDVNLAMSAGELQGVLEAEAAAGDTLSYVENAAGGNGEFLAYRDADLVAGYTYTVGPSLYRGLYGTTGTLHALGSRFARLDASIFKYDLPAAWIGQTLYFKFASFNLHGLAEEDIAALPAYEFTPAGVGFGGGAGGVPTVPTGLAGFGGVEQVTATWNANPASDNVDAYRLSFAVGPGGAFGAAVEVGEALALTMPILDLPAGGVVTLFLEAKNAVGYSAPSAGVDVTVDSTAILAPIYVPSTYYPDAPTAAQVLLIHTFAEDVRFPVNFAGSQFGATAAAAGAAVFNIWKATAAAPNAWTLVGTATVALGAVVATFASVGGVVVDFNIGDRVRATAPAVADATLTNPNLTLLAQRRS